MKKIAIMNVRISAFDGRFLVIALATILGNSAFGQAPTITSVDQIKGSYGQELTIKGNNFGTDASKLKVYFGPASAKVKSITNQLMRIVIPAGAAFDNISVTNTANGLTGYSPNQFMLSFGGTVGLAVTNFAAEYQKAAFESADGYGLYDLALGDFNGDNLNDVICASQKSGALAILLNGSSPGSITTTKSTTNLTTNIKTLHIASGDLNGDGKLDVVATEGNDGNRVIIYQNNGTTSGVVSWGKTTVTLTGRKVKRVAIADLDLDGKPEIIVSDKTVNTSGGNSIISILPNKSTISSILFATVVNLTIPAAASTDVLEIKDLNGDGSPEIVTSQFNTDKCNIFICANKSTPGNFNLNDITTLTADNSIVSIRLGDLDGDQKADIIATRFLGSDIAVFRNTSNSSSQFTFASPQLFKTNIRPAGLDLGDLDGDGKLDIAICSIDNTTVNGSNNGTISVLNNQSVTGNISFAPLLTLPSKYINRHVKISDMDGDAKPDIVFASIDDDSNGVPASFVSIFQNTTCTIPAINPVGPLTVCTGNTVKLTANNNPGTTYSWSNGNSIINGQTNSTLSVTATGNYSVTATNGTCSQSSNIVSITVSTINATLDAPSVISNSPVCTGDALALKITDISASEYQWRGPNSYAGSGLTASPAVTNFTVDNAGIYVVDVVKGGTLANGGCVARTDSTTVLNTNIPSFSITSSGSNTICANTSKILSISPVVTSGFTYQWYNGTDAITGATGSTYSVTASGSYSAQVAYSVGCSPKTTASTAITLLTLPSPKFSVSPTPSCSGTELTFTNQSEADPNGTASYAWTFGDNTTSNLPSPTHTYTASGNFQIFLTADYSGLTGCAVTTNKNLPVAAATKPTITIPTPGICLGETKQLKIEGTFTTINWSSGTTGSSITINQPGTYSVNTIDANGCAGKGELIVVQNPTPAITVTADKTVIAPGQTAQLTAAGADSYKWTPIGTLDNATIASPKATPLLTTTYVVDGFTLAGCSAKDSITIKVDGGNTIDLKVTNVFTPNGDGHNDIWIIPGIESYQDCTLSVYDHNGSKVFEQKGYKNDWDGNYKGQPAPQGTYYYVFICSGKNALTGSVLLAR